MRVYRLVVAVALAVTAFAGVPAVALPQLPVDVGGTLDGAPYRIRVPQDWNGTLLVFAHGYGRQVEPFLPITPSYVDATQEERFLDLGYALAASAFEAGGWEVEGGVADTRALTELFADEVAEPERTILWGRSMGSVVAFESIERYPELYDAAIPMCALGAGSTRTFDGVLGLALAYDAVFGWPEAWGSVGDVTDDLSFADDVAPVLTAQAQDPGNLARFEFLRLVNRLPEEGWYTPPSDSEPPFLFQVMFFATEGRAELEQRAGGPVAQNVGHRYTLTADQRAYLNGLGADTDGWLDTMQQQEAITAPPLPRNFLQRWADYTGWIDRPVLTVHGDGDGLVPAFHAPAYRELVASAGRTQWLAQTFTDTVGHCDFTTAQLEAVVSAMESWLETGAAPGADAFPEAVGFLPDYDPAPFPQPPPPGGPPFGDIAGTVHEQAVIDAAIRALVGGYPDATYRPAAPVTRGQAATLVTRLLDLPAGKAPFTDVAGSVHADAIGAAAAADVVEGYPDGTYRPGAVVARGQLASLVARALDLPGAEPPFTDIAGSIHADAIGAVAAAGIMEGYADGTFRPGFAVTRGQAAAVLTRTDQPG